jgi:hypothetical protein
VFILQANGKPTSNSGQDQILAAEAAAAEELASLLEAEAETLATEIAEASTIVQNKVAALSGARTIATHAIVGVVAIIADIMSVAAGTAEATVVTAEQVLAVSDQIDATEVELQLAKLATDAAVSDQSSVVDDLTAQLEAVGLTGAESATLEARLLAAREDLLTLEAESASLQTVQASTKTVDGVLEQLQMLGIPVAEDALIARIGSILEQEEPSHPAEPLTIAGEFFRQRMAGKFFRQLMAVTRLEISDQKVLQVQKKHPGQTPWIRN